MADRVTISVQRDVLKDALSLAKMFEPDNYSQAIRQQRTINKLKALLKSADTGVRSA